MPSHSPLLRLARFFLLPLSSFSNWLGNRFYLGLAVVVTLAALYAISTNMTGGMKNHAYDLIMKYRFNRPVADPQIVILDIDEAALAAMAPEYGRWPWPRNIMGELVEGLAAQKPQAIVFDVTFSDPDVFNAAGDKYFRDVIRRAPSTYFPMIRLNEEADPQSDLKLSQLPGVSKLEEDAPADATIAAVVPYFFDVLTDLRLGANNLEADADGVVRNYPVYLDAYTWRLGSLPANVAAALGVVLPEEDRILLNWRGRPPAYRRVSLHEVYFDLLKRQRARPADEFTNKIVIIGSTAPSLFDMKPTSMAKLHPGVEILATALDNLKNGDSLTELPRWVYILTTLIALVLLTLAFVYSIDQRIVNLTFTILQAGFLAVSYLTLNFSTVFVDLTAPFAFSLLYFTVARFNSLFTGFRRNGHPFFSTLLDEGHECRAILVQCHIHIKNRNARLALGARIKRQAGLAQYSVVTPPLFKGLPLLHAFFRDTIVLYALVPKEDELAALADVVAMLERTIPAIEKAVRRQSSVDGPLVTYLLHGFTFKVDAEETWRLRGEEGMARLFGMASELAKTRPPGLVRIVTTAEFKKLSRGVEVSETLRKAGL